MSFKSSKKRSYSRHEQSKTSHEGGTDCVWPGPGFDENISINHGYCRAGGGQEEGWWIISPWRIFLYPRPADQWCTSWGRCPCGQGRTSVSSLSCPCVAELNLLSSQMLGSCSISDIVVGWRRGARCNWPGCGVHSYSSFSGLGWAGWCSHYGLGLENTRHSEHWRWWR